MIKIKNLTVTSNDDPLLSNINMTIEAGEIHAITGPKFSGKSALAHVITGHPGITIEKGSIHWGSTKINHLPTEDRIAKGMYISFQTPSDFEDLTNWDLFQLFFKGNPSEISDLQLKYDAYCDLLDLGELHGDLRINASEMTPSQFKKNELLYMMIKDPEFIILDEIDDGLSTEETLKIGAILREYFRINKKTCLIITRNQELLDIIKPTHVHILSDGEILMSGGPDLYKRIVEDGQSEFSTSTKRGSGLDLHS